MREPIKVTVRKDGVRFADREHFIDGSPIQEWWCTNNSCGNVAKEVKWSDEPADNNHAAASVTGGFYGPNGNGYNYWCRKCHHRMQPKG